jgi:hypothetical protein
MKKRIGSSVTLRAGMEWGSSQRSSSRSRGRRSMKDPLGSVPQRIQSVLEKVRARKCPMTGDKAFMDEMWREVGGCMWMLRPWWRSLLDEPDFKPIPAKLLAEPQAKMYVVTAVEAVPSLGKDLQDHGPAAKAVSAFLRDANVQGVDVPAHILEDVVLAYSRYGKGTGYPALRGASRDEAIVASWEPVVRPVRRGRGRAFHTKLAPRLLPATSAAWRSRPSLIDSVEPALKRRD